MLRLTKQPAKQPFQSLSSKPRRSQTGQKGGLSTGGGPDAALTKQIHARFQQTFGGLARDRQGFHATMKTVFGGSYDPAKAEQFRGRTLAGDFSWLPRIQYVDSRTLGQGGMGAYDAKSGVVFLNRDMAGNPELLAQTFIEEVGHHLDTKLNRTDSPGDEGELFRRILGGEPLSSGQVRAIRAENDKGVIQVNGKPVEVEFFLKKAFKKVTGAVKSVARGVTKTVKKATGGIFGGIKKIGKSIVGGIKKVGGGILGGIKKAGEGIIGGIKKIGKGVLNALGPVGKAIGKVGSFLNKAVGKIIKTFDFLSPALLLIPGVGPGLYAAYNVMKTAYYAANGDLKQAFFSGLGALTGVGGVAGKVAGMAQRGMDMFEAAKSALKGDVRGMIGLVGAAAGGMGGKLGAKLSNAAQMAEAGIAVHHGIQRGDMAAVLGGLSAGAGVAGQAKWMDPKAAARIQEITAAAGNGAQAVDLMMRGDASGAIAALNQTVGGLAPRLGADRAKAVQDVLGHAARGAAAFEALRSNNPADALATIAGSFDKSHERIIRGGAELARMVDVGDGAGMLRQLELLTSLGGATLGDAIGGGASDLRRLMENASPLSMRVANAFANDLTDDAFDLVRRGVSALASGRAEQRAGMGLALSRMGFGLAESVGKGDVTGAGRALDLAFAMAGIEAPEQLPSALGLGHLTDLMGNDRLASRSIDSFAIDGLSREIQTALRELAPWMDRGATMFGELKEGRVENAIRELFSLVEDNGVALPKALL